MKLSDVCKICTNLEDADFWICRRGSLGKVGFPTQEFNAESIGVKVLNTDLLNPRFLFYWFEGIHAEGVFKALATGTTNLVNIKVSDIKNIQLG
ncbi:hypothetical protein JK628_02760 [Shewanella sp. KX20019]|uniref:hypothetical protein n=1 Tax=Shewanella sp. KX20019 TaxID=2803864 RepID=UPI0019269354|nr:hypothetical protein [Shewanella sp. KX20019]QQX80810.1 hypothetical protein JK628_02760 [Shewanella sp. KX20019]